MKTKISMEMSIDELKEYIDDAFTEGFHMRREAEEKQIGGKVPIQISLKNDRQKYIDSAIKRLILKKLDE